MPSPAVPVSVATVVHAPHPWSTETGPGLFLAGSIEMGAAAPWQDR